MVVVVIRNERQEAIEINLEAVKCSLVCSQSVREAIENPRSTNDERVFPLKFELFAGYDHSLDHPTNQPFFS